MFRTPIDLKYCTVELLDGTAGTNVNSLTIRVGGGNLTWSEKRNIEYVRDRGLLDTVRRGDEEPLEVRLNVTYTLIMQDTTNSANEPIMPIDALKKRNGASSWVSSSPDACEPYSVNMRITYDPLCPNIKNEVVLFPDFRYETLEMDVKAGTLNITGKCNVKEPTVTRTVDTTPETGAGV